MVTLVSLVITIVAGNFVGNAVGNQLLSQQTTSSQQSRQMDAGPEQNGSGKLIVRNQINLLLGVVLVYDGHITGKCCSN